MFRMRAGWPSPPDGKRLAAISGVVVRLLDVESGRELDTLAGNTNMLKSLAWSPDRKWLAIAGSDIQIHTA